MSLVSAAESTPGLPGDSAQSEDEPRSWWAPLAGIGRPCILGGLGRHPRQSRRRDNGDNGGTVTLEWSDRPTGARRIHGYPLPPSARARDCVEAASAANSQEGLK